MGPILANTGTTRQATRRSTRMVVTGSALERGCVGKLLRISKDRKRQQKTAKDRKRSKKEHAREKAGGPWGVPWPAWGGP